MDDEDAAAGRDAEFGVPKRFDEATLIFAANETETKQTSTRDVNRRCLFYSREKWRAKK